MSTDKYIICEVTSKVTRRMVVNLAKESGLAVGGVSGTWEDMVKADRFPFLFLSPDLTVGCAQRNSCIHKDGHLVGFDRFVEEIASLKGSRISLKGGQAAIVINKDASVGVMDTLANRLLFHFTKEDFNIVVTEYNRLHKS